MIQENDTAISGESKQSKMSERDSQEDVAHPSSKESQQ